MLKKVAYRIFFVSLPVQMWSDVPQSLYSSLGCALSVGRNALTLR